jgi:rare lipoprotein A
MTLKLPHSATWIIWPALLVVALGAGIAIGWNHGVNNGRTWAAREYRPEVDRLETELTVADERNMMLIEAFSFRGTASWYGDKEHGNIGANNKRFNKFALTMATKFLPFGGMKWRVTCLETGASIVLESTDDGPNIPGRLFDLSYQAAVELGMIEKGLIDVLIAPAL